MLATRRSRAYFGRSLHGEGPIAYLCLDVDPRAETSGLQQTHACLAHLREMLAPGDVDRDGDGAPARWQVCQGDAPGHRLGMLLVTAVEQVLGSLGEAGSVSHQVVATGADCGLELLIACEDVETGRRAGEWAVRAVDRLLAVYGGDEARAEPSGDLATALRALRDFAASRRTPAASAALMAAARERGIPVVELDRWPFGGQPPAPGPALARDLLLGWGLHGVRLRGTATDRVSTLTYATLNDRQACHDGLRRAGVPVPTRDPELRHINRASRAVRVATRIGYPVVVKPAARGAGATASGALSGAPAVAEAYARLAAAGIRQVVIERYVPGHTYRLLVVGQAVIAATRWPGRPAEACGGSEAAARFDPDRLCAAVKAAAVSACGCFGLPLAAVELVTADAAVSLEASGGAVTAVDPVPDLADYTLAGERVPMTAARQFLAALFPRAGQARIPICAITGTNGKTTTSRMLARILQAAGHRVGLACTDGVYVQGQRRKEGTFSGIAGALTVFLQPDVDCAVLETSRGTLVRQGLAFDRCDVAACTNVASDHLDEEGILTLEQLATLKRLVVESAERCVVLNGDDPRCLAMRPFVKAKPIYLVARDGAADHLAAHLAAGGLAVVLVGAQAGPVITLRSRDGDQPIVATNRVPATHGSAARHNIDNAMFAAALAHGLGVPIPIIQAALEGFSSSIEDTPGRLNIVDGLPFTVILDYAHNPHGMAALCEFIDRLPIRGRRHIVVYWTRQTPREADLRAAMGIIAARFDRFICRDAADAADAAAGTDGRSARTVAAVLVAAGAPAEAVIVIPDLHNAIAEALLAAAPGDLVVIITGSKAPAVWQQVQRFHQHPPARAASGASAGDGDRRHARSG